MAKKKKAEEKPELCHLQPGQWRDFRCLQCNTDFELKHEPDDSSAPSGYVVHCPYCGENNLEWE